MAALYIHVPFCERKCVYCGFASFDNKGNLINEYFDALHSELILASELHTFQGVSSVFFGGGTPSFVDAAYISQTMERIKKYIGLLPGAEVTLEANPNTLRRSKLETYLAAGINRLSIGLQSAQNSLLSFLGRTHTREQFQKAYADAQAAGFENISVDVIFGIPKQTTEDFMHTLQYVADIAPAHVSAYSLSIEPGTPLFESMQAGDIHAADEEEERTMYHKAYRFLTRQGYKRYEISNFARPGLESRHNLAYWNRDQYLGVGAAAHSCVSEKRFANTEDLGRYISCLRAGKMAYNTMEELDEKEREEEFIMLKLRLSKGFALEEYRKLFSGDFCLRYAVPLKKLQKAGLLKIKNGRVIPTGRGFDLQNAMVLELLK